MLRELVTAGDRAELDWTASSRTTSAPTPTSNANEELNRRGICVEEQDGAGLSLSFKQVHGRSGRSTEAQAVRTDAAWMMYRDDGLVLGLE